MHRAETGVKGFAKLIVHTLLGSLFLVVWLVTAWSIDKLLLVWFPLEGMSMISFRLLEGVLHVSTFRAVFRIVFGRRERNSDRWWK